MVVVIHLASTGVSPIPPSAYVFVAGCLSYSGAVWLILSRLRNPRLYYWLTRRFAEIDIAWWTFAMYVTGGPSSPLFPLMMLRAADHIHLGATKALWHGHLSVACYLFLLGWTAFVENRATSWAIELTKLTAIYAANLYISLAAKVVDGLHQKMRTTQRALKEAKDEAEAASRAKSDFLAGMSHELRTPLNAIIGYSQLLWEQLERLRPEQIRTDLHQIETSGMHLLDLVNQVLDFERLGSHRITVTIEPFDCGSVAREVVAVAQTLARRRGNSLTLAIESGAGLSLGDAARFRQSLLNLVGNACKFTSAGEIVVTVAEQERDGRQLTAVAVRDSGIGIKPEHMDKLFQAFSQADSSIGKKYGGTGLGLALTKQFCELMGGEVSVQSEFGKGSEFVIRLPKPPAVTG
jgi:signal transduction histidine kinase